MFYVYVYINPVNLEPIYIGKGTADRDHHHWWNKNTLKNNTLKEILLELNRVGQRPIINRLYETEDELDAYATEKKLIQQYGRLDLQTGSLCNRTPGGEGFGNTGTTWSIEQRQKIRSKYLSRSPGVGFAQYDMTGQLLRTFKNANELRQIGFKPPQIMAIRKCCKGERYSVKRYRWSYSNQPLPAASTCLKAVRQSTKLGEFIATHISVAAASQKTGINQGDIASVARGNTRMKSAGGFVWSYA